MIRYTTPTHEHVVNGVDLTGCHVVVSYEQRNDRIEVQAKSVRYENDQSVVTVSLTQRQTGRLRAGKAKAQINWIYPDGTRNATTCKEIDILENILAREVKYGD